MKHGVNALIANTTIIVPLIFFSGYALTRMFGSGLNDYRLIELNKLSNNVIISFTQEIFFHLMKIPYKVFKDDSNKIFHDLTKSLTGIERMNRFVIGNIISNYVEIFVVSALVLYFAGPKYFVSTAVTYGLYFYFTRKIATERNPLINNKFAIDRKQYSRFNDVIFNIENVKYFNNEKLELSKILEITQEARQAENKVIDSLFKLNFIQSVIICSGLLVNLVIAIVDIHMGVMTPGDIIMLQAFFIQVSQPLFFMGMIMRELDETQVNIKFAINMLKMKTKEQQMMAGLNFNFQGGRIEFDNVCFFHTENGESKTIFNNLNFVMEEGSNNAIIGPSGNGKTTIFNMIYKLYIPNSGKILIDGQDLNRIDESEIRRVP